jgi:hypothetical protein
MIQKTFPPSRFIRGALAIRVLPAVDGLARACVSARFRLPGRAALQRIAARAAGKVVPGAPQGLRSFAVFPAGEAPTGPAAAEKPRRGSLGLLAAVQKPTYPGKAKNRAGRSPDSEEKETPARKLALCASVVGKE